MKRWELVRNVLEMKRWELVGNVLEMKRWELVGNVLEKVGASWKCVRKSGS